MKWCWLAFWFVVVLVTHADGQITSELNHSEADVERLIDLSKKDQWIDSYRSLSYADQALRESQELNFKKGIARANNLKAFCYWSFGDNDLALQSALEALQVIQAEPDNFIEAESYYMQARAYMDLQEDNKAHEAIQKAESLAKQASNWEQLCSIYNLRGVILYTLSNCDSALYFYNKAYETGKAHAVNPINFPRIMSNIGECYQADNPVLALSYFEKALALAKETNNKIAEASITSIIGHAHVRSKEYRKAEDELQYALELARSLGLRRVVRHAYGGLVNIKLEQGKGDDAVVYLRRYYAVRDSLLNTSKIRQIVELETKHELALKEQNIKLLQSEAQIQRLQLNILIGAILVLVILSFGLLQWQRYRYRKNREMLNLEIDYLTQQHKETVDRYKGNLVPEQTASLETYDQKLLKRAIALVEEHITDPQLSVEKLAADMNMSRTSLHRKIKSITGFPPSELIRSIRLRKAAKLIANRVDTATQIAVRVGFDDYSHFSKAFKKHFGVSPTSYEEQAGQVQPTDTETTTIRSDN